ncbi:MAG: hypothetical protein IJ053_06740 [Lachnospiraceae bacterium]|nr:hypothetical protein [Lachnospiraceae bacterium]
MYKIDDRGSAVVEMTLIMPIIIFIMVFVLFWFLDVINDGIVQGETYSELYTLSIGDNAEIMESNLVETFDSQIVGNTNIPQVEIRADRGIIYAYIDSSDLQGGGVYLYQGSRNTFSREYNLCTDRLRRWQLYGDLLRE